MGFYRLATITPDCGNTVQAELHIPERDSQNRVQYVEAIELFCSLELVSALVSAAVAQRQWCGLMPGIRLLDQGQRDIGAKTEMQASAWRIAHARANGQLLTRGDAAALGANSNATATHRFRITIPFRLNCLKDPELFLPLASRFSFINIRFCAPTFFGVGQVITEANSSVIVCARTVSRKELLEVPELVLDKYALSTWENEPIPVEGRPLLIGLADLDISGGGTTTFGATDFTDFELRGAQEATHRIAADDFGRDFQDRCLPNSTDWPLPASGTADFIPLFCASNGCDVGDLPLERSMELSCVRGVGAPALTDQHVLMWVVRAANTEAQAESVGASKAMRGSKASYLRAANLARNAALPSVKAGHKRLRGNAEISPYLPHSLDTKVVAKL